MAGGIPFVTATGCHLYACGPCVRDRCLAEAGLILRTGSHATAIEATYRFLSQFNVIPGVDRLPDTPAEAGVDPLDNVLRPVPELRWQMEGCRDLARILERAETRERERSLSDLVEWLWHSVDNLVLSGEQALQSLLAGIDAYRAAVAGDAKATPQLEVAQ